jgi:hypothetical protein
MQPETPKIFTIQTVSFATFLGGPLAASLLLYFNYKTLKKNDAARNSLFLGILFTFILIALLLIIPENRYEKLIPLFVTSFNTLGVSILFEKLQSNDVRKFLENNGRKASFWNSLVYSLLGLAITATIVFTLVYFMPYKGYENKIAVFRKVSLHYSKNIKQEQAARIANLIKVSNLFEGNEDADIFLNEDKNCYHLRFITIDPTVLKDSLFIEDFNNLEKFLNYNINPKKPIIIGFLDPNLEKNFELTKTSQTNKEIYEAALFLTLYKVSDNHTIYHSADIPETEINTVAKSVQRLKSYFPVDKHIDIIFLYDEGGYTLKFFASKNLWNKPSFTSRLVEVANYIRKSGIRKPIRLKLIDESTLEETAL